MGDFNIKTLSDNVISLLKESAEFLEVNNDDIVPSSTKIPEDFANDKICVIIELGDVYGNAKLGQLYYTTVTVVGLISSRDNEVLADQDIQNLKLKIMNVLESNDQKFNGFEHLQYRDGEVTTDYSYGGVCFCTLINKVY